MRTRSLALLLGVAVLGGWALPRVQGSEDCPDCVALKAKLVEETAALQQQIRHLTAQRDELEKALRETTTKGMDLSAAVGFYPDRPRPVFSDPATIGKFVQDELKGMVSRDQVVVPEKGYVEEEEGGYAGKREGDRVTVRYWQRPALPVDCTLEILFQIQRSGLARMRHDIERLAGRVAELSR